MIEFFKTHTAIPSRLSSYYFIHINLQLKNILYFRKLFLLLNAFVKVLFYLKYTITIYYDENEKMDYYFCCFVHRLK